MNTPTPIDTGITEVKPEEIKEPTMLSKVSGKIPQLVKDIFNRFYSNKKIFWLITSVFGLLFLVIILGLLFGNRNVNQVVSKLPTPTPFIESSPQASPSGGVLTVTGNQLKDLNNQINSLDISQSKLKPPAINYNISF